MIIDMALDNCLAGVYEFVSRYCSYQIVLLHFFLPLKACVCLHYHNDYGCFFEYDFHV